LLLVDRADALARFIGQKMSSQSGQSILIDNKAGAGGVLRVQWMSFNQVTVTAFYLHPLVQWSSCQPLQINPNYRPDRDLVAIGQAVNTPSVAVVSSKSRFNQLSEMLYLLPS
jgi:tripartite-type tricarboxylate transporter receptor subunit TctC